MEKLYVTRNKIHAESFWNRPRFKFQAQLKKNINLAIAFLGLDEQGVKPTSAS